MLPSLSSVELVITDWSGVISDDRRPVYESNMRMLESRSMPRITFEEWLPRTQLSAIEFLENMGVEQVDATEAAREYSLLLHTVRSEGTHPVAYADAPAFLERLQRRSPAIVVSSHPEEHLRAEADEYAVSGWISRFVGSARDKGAEIRNALGDLPLDRVLYMGDTVYDVRAARNAGVIAVAMGTGYHDAERLRGEHPDFLFGSLSELGEALGL